LDHLFLDRTSLPCAPDQLRGDFLYQKPALLSGQGIELDLETLYTINHTQLNDCDHFGDSAATTYQLLSPLKAAVYLVWRFLQKMKLTNRKIDEDPLE
jgi:hypothetical protein